MTSCTFDIKLRSVAKAIPILLEIRQLLNNMSESDKIVIDKIVANHYSISISDLLPTPDLHTTTQVSDRPKSEPISVLKTAKDKPKEQPKATLSPPSDGAFFTILEIAEALDTSLVEVKRLLTNLGYAEYDKSNSAKLLLTYDGMEFGKLDNHKHIIYHESILDILKTCHYIIAE
jgi:hypothetical protein